MGDWVGLGDGVMEFFGGWLVGRTMGALDSACFFEIEVRGVGELPPAMLSPFGACACWRELVRLLVDGDG